jgi:hypothetical protein
MDQKSLGVMLKLYLDPDFEDSDITREYLQNSGIDTEAFKKKMIKMLNKNLAEIKYERGEKLKKEYLRTLQNEQSDELLNEANLQYAFRKMEKLDYDDITDIEKDKLKLAVLKKLAEKNGTNSDKPEETQK